MPINPFFLQGLVLTGWLGKIGSLLNFVLMRVAGWSGALMFYKKGKRTKLKRYYALSALVYTASWLVLFAFSAAFWHWIHQLVSRI